MPALILTLLLLVTGTARAADVYCTYLPLCLPPYAPPLERIRVYEGGKMTRDMAVWDQIRNGNLRTNWWHCSTTPAAVLDVRVVQSGKELGPVTWLEADAAAPACGGSTAPKSAGPVSVSSFKRTRDYLGTILDTCVGDPSCGQLVMDTCFKTPACRDKIAPTLKLDIDHSGDVTWIDSLVVEWLLAGKVP